MINNSVPQEVVTIYNNALALSNKGKLDKALEEYKKAIDMFPGFIEAYNNIGEIHSQQGDKEKAIATYMEALKIERNPRVLLNIGVEHYNNDNPSRALDFFKESVSIMPDFLEGNFYSGLILYGDKKYEEAEKHLAAVIGMDRRHLKANYMLSYIYYEWKQYDRTLACLESIKDIADDKTFLNKYFGFCCYYLGRYEEAVTYLTVALESKPQYRKLKKYLKNLTYEKKIKEIGDVDKAIKELEGKIMNSDPQFMEITRLSMLYIFKGDSSKAEKMLLDYKKKIAS